MGKVRVIKKFEEREVFTKTGKVLYVAQCMVNYIVDEQEEYVVNFFSDFPNIQLGEYEVQLNNLNLRLKQPKMPGIPGVPNLNSAKNLDRRV